MPPAFKAPKDQAEFNERTKDMTLDGARVLLKSVNARRRDAVKPYDDEINFLMKVINIKKTEVK